MICNFCGMESETEVCQECQELAHEVAKKHSEGLTEEEVANIEKETEEEI